MDYAQLPPPPPPPPPAAGLRPLPPSNFEMAYQQFMLAQSRGPQPSRNAGLRGYPQPPGAVYQQWNNRRSVYDETVNEKAAPLLAGASISGPMMVNPLAANPARYNPMVEDPERSPVLRDSLYDDDAPPKKRSWWRKKRFIFGIAIVITIIILGVIIGNVVTSKGDKDKKDDSSSDSKTEADSKSSSPTGSGEAYVAGPVPTGIFAKSALSAAAYRDPKKEEDHIAIAYQNPDGSISIIEYAEEDGKSQGSWRKPFVAHAVSGEADTAGLAITFQDTSPSIQMDMSYQTKADGFKGTHCTVGEVTYNCATFSFSTSGPSPAPGSAFSSHGPLTIFQEEDGRLVYRKLGLGRQEKPSYEHLLDGQALMGTRLAILPMSKSHDKIQRKDAVGILYQKKDGKLGVHVKKPRGKDISVSQSWPRTLPDITIPSKGSFTGFSVARSSDKDSDLVNTFILYQDESTDIKQIRADGGDEWEKSSPEALKGADKGTSITCTTMETLESEGAGALEPASSMTRCYFLRKGELVEAQLNGKDWKVLGNVPLS